MSTPPPTFNIPPGTPVHTRSSTTDGYFPKYEDRNLLLPRFAAKMSPFIVGPIGAQAFLDRFLPPGPAPSHPSPVPSLMGVFDHFIELLSECETSSYDEFVSSDTRRPPHLVFFV
jgi:hypothetical protein